MLLRYFFSFIYSKYLPYSIILFEGSGMGNVMREQPLTVKETCQDANKRMSCVVTSMCGWRQTMEDAHIVNLGLTKQCSLFAVFDGHGGSEVSAFAAKHFERELVKNKHFQNKKYEAALIETYKTLDLLMLSQEGQKEIKMLKKEASTGKENHEEDEPLSAGSTAVVCLITEHDIFCANAGDSRCMIYKNKAVVDMSEDHKPDNKEELKRISGAGGTVVDGRVKGCLNLSRALGDFEFKGNKTLNWDEQMVTARPDVVKQSLDGTEYIVLGCDGIFEEKTNKEIMNIVKHKPNEDLKVTAEKILDTLVAKTSQEECGMDNMSLIIVKMAPHH